jgi:hypothetical protein
MYGEFNDGKQFVDGRFTAHPYGDTMDGVKLLDRPDESASEWKLRFEADIDSLIAEVPEDLLEGPFEDVEPREFGWGQLLLALTRPRR